MIDERDFLAALHLAEDMGDTKGLASGLEWFRCLERSRNAEVQSELKRLKGLLNDWRTVEEQHGVGCKLRLSHPTVTKFVERRVISEEQLANAFRYSEEVTGRADAAA